MSERRYRCFVISSLTAIIIIILIIPMSVMSKIAGQFQRMYEGWDCVGMFPTTGRLMMAFSTVVVYWHLYLLLIALFVPLVLWLLTRLPTRFLTLLLVFFLGVTVGFIGVVLPVLVLLYPIVKTTFALAA